jgi:hypothetical protein
MRIELKNLPEQAELIRALGSKDEKTSREAQQIFAALMSKTISYVFPQADTSSWLYRDITFNEDDDPSFPIELYTELPAAGHFSIWSQTVAGGLPTNEIHQPIDEVKFHTYRLDSAYSFNKRYARKARLDVIGKAVERIMQEILLKTQRHAWSVILAGLASASHNGIQHVVKSQNAGAFTVEDLNKLFTRIRRINSAWTGGTPVSETIGLTDIAISPEIKERVRAFSYNPINTANALGQAVGTSAGVISIPEAQRAAMFNGGGVQEIFGVGMIELLELGIGKAYNTLFSEFAGNTSYTNATGGAAGAFTGSTQELIIGLDLSKDFAYRALGVNEDYKSTFTFLPDDQFQVRSEKVGFYGYITEGRLLLDTRPIVGLIV